MFPKRDIKIPDNNIEGVIKEKTEDFDTSLDHGLSKIKYEIDEEEATYNTLGYQTSNIKCEFEEEETKLQYDVLGNQLNEENFDEPQFCDAEFTENALKIESTINDTFHQKGIKIEHNEIGNDNTEKYDEINTSNIKYEFEEEETKIQYGVFETQLHEENFDKSTTDLPKFRMLDGEFTKSFQKIELPISNTFYKEDMYSKMSQKTDLTILSNKKSHICEFCEQSFNAMETLNIHRIICEAGPYQCEISAKKIGQHNTQTKEKVYKCETCNKCFVHKGTLIRHNKTHTGEKPYKCGTCGKCFAENGTLIIHNRTHTGEKPYKCETCGKCYAHKGILIIHNRTHTGEKPYKCEICGKCFTQKESLNKHNRTHSGEKPYTCETCGKCFVEQSKLIAHNRTHTGEKPYKCETCGKCFAQQGGLIVHNRTHTGEKPYKCETCGKCLTRKESLNIHNRTHSGEKPYKCESCGKCFIEKRSLKFHNRTHKGESI